MACALCKGSGLLWAGKQDDVCPLCDAVGGWPFEELTAEELKKELLKLSPHDRRTYRIAVRQGRGVKAALEPRKGKARFKVMTQDRLRSLTVQYSQDESFGNALRHVLEEHGVAIVSHILSADECADFEALKLSECSLEAPLHKTGRRGSGDHCHGELAWKARLHPRVRGCFAQIFGTGDLSCSADQMGQFYTPRESAKINAVNHEWLHVDQNVLTGSVHRCYQGVLYIWSSENEGSTTAVWPGSHGKEHYGQLMQDPVAAAYARRVDEFGVKCGQFVPLSAMEDQARRDDLHRAALMGTVRVPVPAGSFLLWDSRITHQGWQSGPRLAVPVCWEPRERVSLEATARKIRMAFLGVPSTHSPSEGHMHPNFRGYVLQRTALRPYSTKPPEEMLDGAWEELYPPDAWQRPVEEVMAELPLEEVSEALRPEIMSVL